MSMPDIPIRANLGVNPQNKINYCKWGEENEKIFLAEIAPKIGMNVRMNPEKEFNRYAHDFILDTRKKADLKAQTAPFFKSSTYGCDPHKTATFNCKDYRRYKELYPNIHVIWWISFPEEERYGIHVPAQNGVWVLRLKDIEKQIEEGAPIHTYKNRINDTRGNAKDSYLIALHDKFRFA